MRKVGVGIVTLVASCSSGEEGDFNSRTQHVTSGADAATDIESDIDPFEERPIEPIDLPYVLTRIGQCGETSCAIPGVLSNVSPEIMLERERNQPRLEFAQDEAERLPGILSVTMAAIARAAELTATGDGAQFLQLTVYLPEEFFDFTRLRGASDEERDQLMAERTEQLSAAQRSAREFIARLGGVVDGSLRLANILYAHIPAATISTLVNSGYVLGIAESGLTPPRESADGVERRRALAMNDDGLQSWTWDGNAGRSANGGAIRFAQIEVNQLNTGHWSFKENSTSSRVLGSFFCNGSSCVLLPNTTAFDNHPTWVASALLSDYNDNQLSVSPPFALAHNFSGIAPEGELAFLRSVDDPGVAQAIDTAVGLGVDIINMSISGANGNIYCSNDSFSGVSEAVRAAENAGVLTVVASGNDHDDLGYNSCSVSSWASFPDALAVGATNEVTSLNDLATVGVADFSGQNLPTEVIQGAGGQGLRKRMIDLVAQGVDVEYLAGAGTIGTAGPKDGTSFSTPQVAGTAGILKHWAYALGGAMSDARHDPYVLRVMLDAMGDGASGSTAGGTRNAIDGATGFGHLRATMPTFIGGDGSWWVGAYTAAQNDIYEIPLGTGTGAEPATINGWKFAALMDVNTFGSAPRVVFELIDKCSPGGGWSVLETSQDATHKARLRLRGSDMASMYRGRCMWVRARVVSASGSFPMRVMEYSYSNSRLYHDM